MLLFFDEEFRQTHLLKQKTGPISSVKSGREDVLIIKIMHFLPISDADKSGIAGYILRQEGSDACLTVKITNIFNILLTVN